MKHISAFAMASLLVVSALLIGGCAKDSNPASVSETDQQTISALVNTDALFTSDATLLNDGDPSLAKVDTAIIPRVWGRKIDPNTVVRNVTQQVVDDTTIVATITTTYSGTLWIRGKYAPTDTVVTTFSKPFTETNVRKVTFVKVANTSMPRMNWRIRRITPVSGGTQGSLITINQVRLFVGTDTLVVTDPLNTWLRVGMPGPIMMPVLSSTFTQGFKVEVTVTSAAPDSDLVSVHRPFYYMGRWVYRAPLRMASQVNNGDGTFTRVYEGTWAGVWTGRHHIFVSAVTRETIFDNVAPVSSKVWGVPFVVE